MNLELYQQIRSQRELSKTVPRVRCLRCRRPAMACFCAALRPFVSDPQFVILIHRDEARRGIASGRMAHLGLKNSLLIEGTDFSRNSQVNRMLEDPEVFSVVLYPSARSINLNELSALGRKSLIPDGKRLVIFVIDGTWATARKMRRLSQNLRDLPEVSFSPTRLSSFRVRKQPRPECLSTLEAIHNVLELWTPLTGNPRPHDNLMEVFDQMVTAQVAWEEKSGRRTIRGPRK